MGGYFIEVEVAELDPDKTVGCMGLGVSCLTPQEMAIANSSSNSSLCLPKRLEKSPQGWYFTGPYRGGTTRRVYRHGKKDIRFILDGEETEPLRWSEGDRMGLLVRPKDWQASTWQWTVSLYINRNIVLACTIDVPKDENGEVPKELQLYGVVEGYGYVTAVTLMDKATPKGLAIAGLKNES